MAYQAEISRESPTCILFVIDQSGSMDEITEAGRSKAAFVADVLNKTLYTLITSCSKSDGVRNYFDVGVIAYAGSQVTSGFGGTLAGDIVHPIQAISENTLRVEERKKKVDDGAGGIIELTTKFPVWFDPKSEGGTPMRAALDRTIETIGSWCEQHPAPIRRPFSTSPMVNRPMARPRKRLTGSGRFRRKMVRRYCSTCTSIPPPGWRSCSRPPKATSMTSTRGCCSACRARCQRISQDLPATRATRSRTGRAASSSTAIPNVWSTFSRSAPDPGWSPTGEARGVACEIAAALGVQRRQARGSVQRGQLSPLGQGSLCAERRRVGVL